MTKKKTRPRKQPGRPQGSTTDTAQAANAQPAACPRCHATDHRVLRKLPDQSQAGQLPDGQPFNAIERRRCVCDKCGQHFMRIERVYDPSLCVA